MEFVTKRWVIALRVAKGHLLNTVWRYGDMDIWRYVDTEIWRYGNMEIWKYGDTKI